MCKQVNIPGFEVSVQGNGEATTEASRSEALGVGMAADSDLHRLNNNTVRVNKLLGS